MNENNITSINKRPHLIPCIIAALMLLGALGNWPYGYYQLLKWFTCAVSVFVAYTAYNKKIFWVTWIFGFVAVLFNPLLPIHFSREIWQPIDFIFAVLFIVIIFVLEKQSGQQGTGTHEKEKEKDF
jgi:hypothetical protein